MELINQTKTNFKLQNNPAGQAVFFKIGEVKDFDKKMAETLLRYEGINTLDSLRAKADKTFTEAKAKVVPVAPVETKSEYELLKEEAISLGIEYAGNISKTDLIAKIEEVKK